MLSPLRKYKLLFPFITDCFIQLIFFSFRVLKEATKKASRLRKSWDEKLGSRGTTHIDKAKLKPVLSVLILLFQLTPDNGLFYLQILLRSSSRLPGVFLMLVS